MYSKFEKWLDKIFGENMPLPGIAINFNLYEDDDSQWSIQIISSAEFDEENPDWCCDEEFSSGEDLFTWKHDTGWEEILDISCEMIRKYLSEGKYADEIKNYDGIAVGFVDGDLEILYTKEN